MGLGLKLNTSAATMSGGVDMQKLRAVSNGSTHFHGSRSGSLITFHYSTPASARGYLLPMGALAASGAPVFTGERGNSLAQGAFNNGHLSVVNEHNIAGAIDYATDSTLARRSAVTTSPAATSPINSFGSRQSRSLLKSNAQAAMQALQADPGMHELVNENFPVVYGLRPDPTRLESISSSIKGEAGIRDGVKPKEIGAIFVPENKVAVVQLLINHSGYNIPVSSLSSFQSA